MRSTAMLSVALAMTIGAGAGAVSAQVGGNASSGAVRDEGTARSATFRVSEGVAELLQDTTLARLVHEALQGNPDLKAAEARVRAARAGRVESALDLAPTVTAAGGFTRQRISGVSFPGLAGTLPDQSLWSAGVQVSWEVDAFGRVRRSLQGRSSLLDASEADVRDARVLLGAEVASAYFHLRGAQDRLEVARQNADNQRRTLGVTEDRLREGRGTALDTERARAQLSSTLAAIPTLEAAVSEERHRLAVLLGTQEDDAVGELAAQALPELPDTLATPDIEEALQHRPDVVAAERRVDATSAFVGAAKAEYLPRLSIQGAAGYTAGAFDALGNDGTGRYAIGPVISWPLFDLGRVKSHVDAAQASRSEARADYDGALLRAREEIATSLVEYRTSRERLEHLKDAADASAHAAELARLRFQEGADDFLEVLDAERRLLEAQDQLSSGRTQATDALVSVYRALGARWTEGARR